jgi:putative ABC transport system permease protein
VLRLIVGGALKLTLAGVALGALLAAAATRFLSSFLYDLSPTDPTTFGGAAALLIVVTLLAGYVAARGNLNANPIAVLRHE